jgi:hypothetical protein
LDDALPSIDDLFKDLLDQDAEMKRQDKQINLHRMPDRMLDRNRYTSSNLRSTLKCGYCDKTSYTEDRCFKKHGYPDDKNGKAKSKGKTSEINRSVTLVLRKLPYTPANNVSKTPTPADNWCFDSGGFSYITNDLNDFDEYEAVDASCIVSDNRPYKGFAIGKVTLPLIGKDLRITPVTFSDVLYVPALASKIISEKVLRSKGVYYNSETSSIFNRTTSGSANHFGTCHDIDGLPHLVIDKERYRSARQARIDRLTGDSSNGRVLINSRTVPSSTTTAALWHTRLSHISDQALTKLAATSEGVSITGGCDRSACDTCCCENDKEHSELVGHHLLGCLLDAIYNPYIPVSYQ